MKDMALLEGLNKPQRQAVCTPSPHVLVIAGAGSGKTRVLVHRIAWLVQEASASPYEIMAVTFTNKAAQEMRERAQQLLGVPGRGLWAGTFHSLCHRMLRLHFEAAGLEEGFQILDSDDQLRLIKRCMRDLAIDDKLISAKLVQWFINQHKDEGKRPAEVMVGDYKNEALMLELYKAYEDKCHRANLVDFAELILRTHELLLNNKDILAHYQSRFRYFLMDEFQDINSIQYAWIRVLAGDSGSVLAVGDDDQSIYSWRGARPQVLEEFNHDFPAVELIRLEQNYRSTRLLLKAANALISHNQQRMGKQLWSDGAEGEPVCLYEAFNEVDEARYVVAEIQSCLEAGDSASDCAILYRSNAQSRVMEEQLIAQQIPYRVYGGLRFFDRAEVRDALAYLRLIANRKDDAAFDRIINTPTRGIGAQTGNQIRNLAYQRGCSLWQAAGLLISEQRLKGRAANAIAGFIDKIDTLGERVDGEMLDSQMKSIIERSGLVDHYQKEPREKAEARLDNLRELVSATKGFVFTQAHQDEGMSPMTAFLSETALDAGDYQDQTGNDCVQLMTMHSAKGLEFPSVFMVGMEQGLFPSQRSSERDQGMEEERRLCYVGMTRARRTLHMSYAQMRRIYGRDNYNPASSFLREIPDELIHEVRPRLQTSQPRAGGQELHQSVPGFELGSSVTHPSLGTGIIIDFSGAGAHAQVQVQFEYEGAKWLTVSFSNLEPL